VPSFPIQLQFHLARDEALLAKLRENDREGLEHLCRYRIQPPTDVILCQPSACRVKRSVRPWEGDR
jgi:hypothetical protein